MKHRGFTLLELLVVIGIIGILVALATVSYTTAQGAGRNSRRKQDMVAIQNIMEQYYSANGFSYPSNDCSSAITNTKSVWPTDPSAAAGHPAYAVTCSASEYCACAKMEGTTDLGNSDDSCNYTAGTKGYFCTSNLQ